MKRVLYALTTLAVLGAVGIVLWLAVSPPRRQLAGRRIPPSVLSGAALQIALGNPSGASASLQSPDNYLILRPQYALSYNDTNGQPNWVSWHLSSADVGTQDRGQFAPDTSLPPEFRKVRPSDYTGTRMDRGHMCPSKDRSSTRQANDATFLMTNIVPQAPACNQGPWKDLEDYCRELAKGGSELYIVCGPAGGSRWTRTGLLIPAATWKAIIVLPEAGGDDLRRIPAEGRSIAVLMPNSRRAGSSDWRKFRVSVSDIERETRYSFWTNLSVQAQEALKTGVDNN